MSKLIRGHQAQKRKIDPKYSQKRKKKLIGWSPRSREHKSPTEVHMSDLIASFLIKKKKKLPRPCQHGSAIRLHQYSEI